MLSFTLIILLILAGALIAYLGNVVGRRIGRARLSISKLRPRYTANLITVLTGALIAFLTLVFLIIVSGDFRAAFFDWEKLVQARGQLTGELEIKNKQLGELQKKIVTLGEQGRSEKARVDALSQEKKTLEADIQKLKEITAALLIDVRSVRSGQLIYKVGEVILAAVIRGGGNPKDSAEAVKSLLSRADATVRLKSEAAQVDVPKDKPLIWLANQELTQAADYLSAHQADVVIRVSAAHNAVAGEVVVVHLELFVNRLIYPNGQVLGQIELAANQSQQDLENKIFALLYQIGQTARDQGVLADPSGLVGSTPYSRVYQIIERVKRSRNVKWIQVVAAKDIFTLGPLDVDFIFEQPERSS